MSFCLLQFLAIEIKLLYTKNFKNQILKLFGYKIKHKQERDGRIRDRIKAVLLHDKGWLPQQIAEAMLISDQAARNHIEDYKASQKLKPRNGGSDEKLSKAESEKLEAHLEQYTYL